MKKIGVIFGGLSVEHEVSVITGMQVMENIDKTKYEVIPIYVNKDGKWLTGNSLMDFKNYKDGNFKDAKEIILSPNHGDNNIYSHPKTVGLFGKKILGEIDIAFPAFHGMNGEDGTVQGIFELMDIPYVGCGVLGSSVGMDKILMKDVYKANELPVVDYTWFYRSKWLKDKDLIIKDIETKLSYPLFVKPANLGSSIGISKAKNREDLVDAIEVAIRYDRKIIIEQAVENLREINCAVLGFDDEVITSLCEEPIGWEEILSFEDKYVKTNEKGGKSSGERRIIPAGIEDNIRQEIEQLAKKAFITIDGRGVSRIDFLLDANNNIYINEINTLPGSIAFYLWEGKGYSFKKLIDELISIAIKVHEEKKENMYSYEANLFNRTQYGSKVKKV
ncbi:D-alanine--D-alanine ligase family protein [uncultured Tissierella sp.]|uniref:D-alanine--D-alanine ligase family protein n=1 Tax=uncultured Tissierella sp. TaxID=448160 RepID=UPI002803E7F5|nr:D-alanine--D-alanine ligase family protein [uncultured Tissierella sp.]MDU5081074.1 D-alanine--D-alanine ligase family protein [Bacillota bacterium]